MQTDFTLAQLADPDIKAADEILRKCVHCGFCTATCPTYVLLGDELDSPRGRIYLIKNLLETEVSFSPQPKVVKHIDRCLSCLSCVTTCPASVDYMHLIDLARSRIEKTFSRPVADKLLRKILAIVVPNPNIFRWALIGARLIRPFHELLPGRLKEIVSIAPSSIPPKSQKDSPQVFQSEGKCIRRVALMTGCAQQVLRPEINEATVRLLTRHGCEVVVAKGAGCCGALVHHMGRSTEAEKQAKANIEAWEKAEVDAIVINTSGCGTMIKDYGWMFNEDIRWAKRAEKISQIACDITEIISDLGLVNIIKESRPTITYHSACSMQHGQQLLNQPKNLLTQAGFKINEPAEGHLCCGSAGTYNLLQPKLAKQLQARKVKHLDAAGGQIIAVGNIGCLIQIKQGFSLLEKDVSVLHTAELLDWATGGPKPPEI
jgi:glycolate oxidase iron-sulfur subunit